MANRKITELTALTGANATDTDVFAIVDVSADETKKMTLGELKEAFDSGSGFVRITGDTMTGALDVQSTITADGLTVDGTATVNANVFEVSSTAPNIRLTETDTTDENTQLFSGAGSFRIRTASDDYATTTERMRIDHGTGDISFYDTSGNASFVYDESVGSTFNEQGADRDFRVESDSSTHMLFVDAGRNAVGVNTSSPKDDAVMEILDGGLAGAAVLRVSADDNAPYALVVANNSHSTTTSHGLAQWMGDDGGARMDVRGGSNQYYEFRLGGTEVVKFHTNNGFVFNENGGNRDFRVESDGNANMLFVDGGNNTVGIGDGAPTEAGLVVAAIGTDANTSAKLALKSTETSVDTYLRFGRFGTGDDASFTIANNFYRTSSGYVADDTSWGPTSIYFGDGEMAFSTVSGAAAPLQRMIIKGSEIVANEQSYNQDFRVESDGNANMLFVDAGLNQVGVGAAPDGSAALDAVGRTLRAANIYTKYAQYSVPTATYVDVYWNDDTITLDAGYIYRFQLATLSTGTNTGVIYWVWFDDSEWHVDIESRHGTSSNNPQGRVSSSKFQIFTNHGSTYTVGVHSEARAAGTDDNTRSSIGLPGFITVYGNDVLVFNEEGEDLDFRVESDNLTHALFVDGGTDRVSVGSSSPTTRFYVNNTNPGDNKTAARITGGTSYVSNGNWEGPLQLDWEQSSNDGYIRMLNIDLTDSGSGNQTNYGIYVNGEDENFFSSNLDVRGSARFNENGGDHDFRVESDSNTHALVVDASNDIVGIGTAPSNLNNNSFLNARAHIANSAYIGSAYYSTIANPNGIQIRLDTGGNGQQAFIRLEGSQYNGYRCTYFWAVNYSGNWTVTSNTNHTSGTAPTFTIDNNTSPQPQINLGFSTGYSGGYCIVNASSHWHII